MNNPAFSLSAYAPYSTPDVASMAWWVAMSSTLKLDRIWFGQQTFAPVVAGVGYASGRGHRAAVGTAVTVMPTTTPFATAQELRATSRLTGKKTCGYLSPGYPEIQRRMTGSQWASPLTATREFVAAVRSLLAGADTDIRGEYFHTAHQATGVDDSESCEIGLGVLRPGMARLAGEIADGFITWLSGAEYFSQVLCAEANAAADAAGRSRPRAVATLHAAPEVPDADVPDIVRGAIGPHLSAPHYRDMLERSEIPLHEIPTDVDLRNVADRGLFCTGDHQEIIDRANALAFAGADEVSIVLHQRPGQGLTELFDDWAALAAAHDPVLQRNELAS